MVTVCCSFMAEPGGPLFIHVHPWRRPLSKYHDVYLDHLAKLIPMPLPLGMSSAQGHAHARARQREGTGEGRSVSVNPSSNPCVNACTSED